MRQLALLISIGLSVACAESPTDPECLANAPSSATVADPAAPDPQLPLKSYFELLRHALSPQWPDWTSTLATLGAQGDGFALQFLGSLDRGHFTPAQREQFDATLAAIAARIQPDTAVSIVPAIRPRLERAAWADLRCEPCEHTCVPWTGQTIASFTGEPAVRAELERLRDGYESVEPSPDFRNMMTVRVRKYAAALLSPQPNLEAVSF
jgi:hypothetical protein